jgi:aminoglycoside phosphotransferase (APT) family kinase protein
MKLHAGEVEIDAALVEGLVRAQFPHLLGPIREVRSTGTVNGIYRLGDAHYVRLPRLAHWAVDLEKEWTWLPRLTPHLSLRVPVPVALGEPTATYPFPWAVYEWLEGAPYDGEDDPAAAEALAGFVADLRAIGPLDGAPRAGRRPLAELANETRAVLSGAALEAWERALSAPAWDGSEPVWVHTDLLRPNVLASGGRVRAVIDFGGVGMGDPAADVIAAWAVLGPAGRDVFRGALEVDDGVWERARGYALHQAAMIVPYYARTNPAFAALARRTIEQVLASG